MKKQKYQAVIFDLDGVICSTDHYHYSAWKQMADRIGITFNETINNRLRGVGRMASLEIILERSPRLYTDAEKTELASEKNRTYQQHLQKMTPKDLSKDVLDTLEAIKALGMRVAIGSSSKNTKLILTQLGLADFFDAVSDGTNITRSKPDPEVYLKASAYIGIAPALCLVVEDAKSGIESGLAAGMDCAAIGDGTRYHIATYNLTRFSELLEIVR